MRYDENLIDQVQSANDISDVVGQYVKLKRTGRNLKACCPFHQEKTPSFMVQPEKQIFHCFGCGVGGNVFSFLMRHENMSFPEALRHLAERAHIRLPEPSKRAQDDRPSERELIYAAYEHAVQYYHSEFMHPERGRAARDYWKQRGFSAETAKEFRIGWAAPEWRGLLEYLSRKGFKDTLLLRAGLVLRSSKGNLYDVFRGRLLFPIQNLQGKAIGFGGRLIGEGDGPKYLNSSENPVFQKRKELFGLHQAKKHIDRQYPRLYVVEGYLDFLQLYQAGFKCTAATLGTALTEDHVRMLKRFAEEAIVIYDGDKAGEAAALRGLEVFLEGGMNVRLLRMPKGTDPDDYIKNNGAAPFQSLLDTATDFFDYKLEIALDRYKPDNPLGLVKITNEFIETLSKIENPILLTHYLKRLAQSLHLDENSLRTELAKLKKKTSEREMKSASAPADVVKRSASAQARDEIILLAAMIEDGALRQTGLDRLRTEDFENTDVRQLFHMLKKMAEQNEAVQWARFLNHCENEELKSELVQVSSMEWTPEDLKRAFADCFVRIKKKKLEKRLEELRKSIEKAEREGDQDRVGIYIKEYQSLLQQVKV